MSNDNNNTTIQIDRKTHAKIKKLQVEQKLEDERPVSIKEIVRDSINYFIKGKGQVQTEG